MKFAVRCGIFWMTQDGGWSVWRSSARLFQSEAMAMAFAAGFSKPLKNWGAEVPEETGLDIEVVQVSGI